MVFVTVSYPQTAESHFDFDYYLQHHTPMVKARWTHLGLEKLELFRGVIALDGTPPAFSLIVVLHFSSMEHMRSAVEEAGPEIMGDIVNFTNVQPYLQINEKL